MKFYYDDNRGTDQFTLQDFEPSFGAKMGAAFDEAWLEGYWSTTSAKRRLSEAANVGAKLSASEVKSRIDASGLRVNIAPKDGEYTDAQISVILERQRELTKAKDVRERTPWDLGSPLRGVVMFGAGIADPINLATAFFPWTRLVGGMRGIRAATESASAVTRFGARAALGAADAGISTAVIEPFYYGMRQSLGDDYTAVDSMANIAFGAAFGGGIHSIGGVGVDMFRRAMGMQQPWQTNVAPAVTGDAIIPPPASMLMGRDVSVRVGDQYEPGQWAVVDADTLTATVDKADNQFRDRGRAAYQAEITARANALDPALVLSVDTPLMDVGTPTIAADGRIIGGNGRTLFIQRAYEIGKAGDYRAELERRLADLGIDPEAVRGMNRPVLVRRLSRNVDVKRAAMLSNEGGSTAMSPLEQAKVDSERLGDAQLETDADGNLDTAGNRAAIRRWVNEQPEGQRNALMTEDGRLSASGLQRLRNAVLFKAYGDSPTLARLIEATDVGSRNVAAALARTAGVVADAEGSISRGELHPLSIAADIRMAVEQFDNLRRQGMKVADYLAQIDMLGDPLTPEGRLLLDFMSRNIVSSRRIGDAISGYYAKLQEAGNPGQGDMFGGVSPDKMGMLRAATEAVDSEPLNAAETVAIISPDTREAALGAAVGQAIDGRSIDVDAIVNTDPAVGGTSTAADVVASAERNQQPEAIRTADFDAAAAVDRRLATAPKWDALSDAEAASAEAETLLNDTIKAGDQAFKYSRGDGQDGTPIGDAQIVNVDGVERSALNSNGRTIHPTVEGVRNFWRWFGDSKVVDADGKPLVVYHGTKGSFDRFKMGVEGGAFFTTKRENANEYAGYWPGVGQAEGGNVMPVYLSIKNPYKVTVWQWADTKSNILEPDEAKQQGFDGYLIAGQDGGDTYIAFEPTQIKSATGNVGTFDPANPDIRYSREIPLYQQGITGHPAVDVIETSIRQSFGDATDALLQRGQIQIVATPADIPGGPHPGDVKAATAPDGTVYMVASNISEADARGLVLHEVGVHVGMEQMLGRDVFQSVLGQLDDAIMRGDDWAQAARDAVPKGTNPAHVREEQLAYLVQNAPDLIAAAKDAGARERLVALYEAILAAVRAWAYRTFEFAQERMTLTEADFRAMAVAALHDAVRRGDRAGVGVMAPAPAGRSVGGLADAYTRGSDQLSEALSDIEALVAKYKDEFPVYFKGSIPDVDRGTARIVEKYWNELSGRTQEFIGPRIARDWETGEQIQAVDSVRGTHIFDLYQELENREFVSGGSVGGAQLFARDGGQTLTPEFRAWFGDSKVVDADGKPLVVYRGSTTDEGSVIRRGWFTSNSRAASLFASKMEDLEKPPQSVVTPAFLSLKNPYIIDANGAYWDEIPFGDPRDGIFLTTDSIAAFARDEKYDGLIIRNVNETDDFFEGIDVFNEGIDVFVAFRPEQIKSATGNVGTFDPNNPDIRYSRGSVPDPSTSKDEIKSADEAVKRAKSYASVLRAAADKLENDAEATAAMRAALPDITPQEIDDLLGQLRKQVTGLRSMARATRSMLDAEDTATGMQDEAMRAADMLANNLQMAAVIEKRNAALNLNVRLKASSFVNQFRDKGLDFEGFAALLTGSQRVRSGARLSVDAEYKGFRGEWMGGMIADIEKLGLWREFVDGAFDRDIYDALHRMGTESPDFTGLPKEAVDLAKVVNKYQTDARNTRNRFGAWIRDLKGYITRQSHDMFKIRDAGEQDWVAYVKERIDVAKMTRLGLISEDDPMSSLRKMYDDFAAGVHMKAAAGEDDTAAFGVGSNLAKRESVSRVLYFKDGIAAFEYNERFGQGRLADSVLSGLEASARSSALLKTLGTNPEATLTRLLNEYENSLVGDPARRSKFRAQRGAIMNMLAQVDGSTLIPGNVTAAKVGSFVRAWTAMTRLGGALISSFTDLAGYGAELRYQGNKNLFSGVLDGIGRATQGRAKGEQRQVLASLGVFHESVIGAVAARFDSPELTGRMAWGMQQFFKWNGLNWWTESLRDGAALSHSHYLAQNAGKSFDKLDGELQRLLSLYNIDAGKWDLLRLGTMKMADGRAYMTPDALATVPRAALENYIQLAGRTVNDATVQNLLDDLSQVLRVMSVDRAHHAVLEPNARARTWMLRGTKPGTVPGEILRYIGQFKSFSVAMIQMVLGREIYGRGYDTLGEYLKKGKGDMLGLATMIGLYTAFGYAAMSIKDMLKGREPRPVDDPRTWYAAMAQGGGLGLYGDFLFGEYSRMGRTFTASLAGPVIGNLDTLADLITRARNGDDLAGSAFKALLDNTPFMNLFYLRPVLDYLVLYQIQEALNPGFLRRMEGRIMRDNSQEFIFPPSQYARGV